MAHFFNLAWCQRDFTATQLRGQGSERRTRSLSNLRGREPRKVEVGDENHLLNLLFVYPTNSRLEPWWQDATVTFMQIFCQHRPVNHVLVSFLVWLGTGRA